MDLVLSRTPPIPYRYTASIVFGLSNRRGKFEGKNNAAEQNYEGKIEKKSDENIVDSAMCL